MEDKIYLYILLIVTLLASWLEISSLGYRIKLLTLAVLLVLAVAVGYDLFPSSIDFDVYNMYYKMANDNFTFIDPSDGIIDYGYVYFVTIVKSFGGDIYDVYFFTCVASMGAYFFALKKYTSYVLIPWFMIVARYYEVQNIIQIRQGLACGIMLFSLQFVKNKKIIPFIICIILAATVHKTLLVALLIYPFSNINWTKAKIGFIYIIVLTLLVLPLTHIIFENMLPSLGLSVAKWDAYQGTIFAEPISNFSLISRIIVFSMFVPWLYKWEKKGYNRIYLSMSLLGLLFLTAFRDMSELSGRLSSIFAIATFFSPVVIFDEYNDVKSRMILMIILTCLCVGLFIKNQIVI